MTAPTGDVGHSPVAGDTVANTGPGGSGTITGVTYGTNAFSTVQSALNAANAGNTVDILAGTYTFASPYQIGLDVTITGEQYDGGETLTGADGVFSISANVTINGGNNLTFSGASGSDPYGSGYQGAAVVLENTASGTTITGSTFSGNAMGIGVAGGVSSFMFSGDSFTGNQVGVVTAGSGTLGTGNSFNANNVSGQYQSEGVYVTGGASVTISGNTFKYLDAGGAATPGGIVVDGGSTVTSTGNTFFGDTDGIQVTSGTLNSSSDALGNTNAPGNIDGVLVKGGSATLSHEIIYANTTGVRVSGGTVSLDHDTFSLASYYNTTDLEIDSGAAPSPSGPTTPSMPPAITSTT